MSILVDLHRYDHEIKPLLAQPVTKGAALFYGSSTFTEWGQERLQAQMAPIKVLNHGFGGSTAEEALYFYSQLIRPYAPKALVWYEGDNDMPMGYSPEEAAGLSIRVFEWARTDFPGLPIVVIPVKHCPYREGFAAQQKRYNDLLHAWVNANRDAYYIDLKSLLYTPTGALRTEVYQADMLHFNDRGYEELAALVKPVLSTIMQEQWI